MSHDPWQFFSDRISWDGEIRVACEAPDASLEPGRQTREDAANANVLATLSTLGERSGSEIPEDEAVSTALARIDAKLAVLLEVFNRHLLGHVQLPPRRPVRFNARGILIEDWTAPASGTALVVHIYFDACVGMPLELPGHVSAAPQEVGGFIAFDGLDESVRQGIEHWVFRQHRRQLAETRRAP